MKKQSKGVVKLASKPEFRFSLKKSEELLEKNIEHPKINSLMEIVEKEHGKVLLSEDYNFIFNKKNGFFARWGKTLKDDPDFSPYGPEILDLEISSGKCSGRCEFCYKNNGEDENTHHLSLGEFKTIFDKMPHHTVEYVLITLKNEKKIKIPVNKNIKLTSGETKKAGDLTEKDEIIDIF